jgi:uncharacterized protein (DUF3820 family)
MELTFGKYKGRQISDMNSYLERSYLLWLFLEIDTDTHLELFKAIREHLKANNDDLKYKLWK